MLFSVSLVLVLLGLSHAKRRRSESAKASNNACIDAPEEIFPQLIDHYTPELGTFSQQYFVCDKFYKPGGPGFILIGGEYDDDAGSFYGVIMQEWGKQYNAIGFLLEHRYYGQSLPFGPHPNVEERKYLSSEQALADLDFFIKNMTQEHQLDNDTKWIAFGGSYPGKLAAVFREKYPESVQGAVAFSAPMKAKLDFFEYWEAIEQNFADFGESCLNNLTEAVETYMSMSKEEQEELIPRCEDWGALCIENWFEGNVQYATEWFNPNTMCTILTDTSIEEPVDRLAKLLNENPPKDEDPDMVAGMSWMYQKCTEFGYFRRAELFHMYPNDTEQMGRCIKKFKMTEAEVQEDIDESNRYYGGFHPNVTNVVFVNNEWDPWRSMGILEDLSPTARAFYIPNSSHCGGMEFSQDPEVLKVQKEIEEIVFSWLN